MTAALKEFHDEFFQDVVRAADASGFFVEDSFFELFCEQLMEAGEIDTADRAQFLGQRGIRVDGYGGDPAFTEGTLSLIISDFGQSPDIETLTATEMEAGFKRLTNFLSKSLDESFRNSLEETSAGFGLAELIASSWEIVSKVRMIMITNRVLSGRVDGRAADEFHGRTVSYSVWDLERLYRYTTSGKSREEVVVDLSESGGSLAALPAHLNEAGYESYLIVVPGQQLASIYEKWGARLLEQNVRVFLQHRGGVNKGIRNTIDNDPEMFFAYNNGITATAEEVFAKKDHGLLRISGLRNFQIVNGGQTTASIYAASRKQVDLSKVFVQMKLSVIPPERSEAVVPLISQFANSQNKVNAADFFANHPFHLRMKQYSETTSAPAPDGTFRASKWFYERARGQYQDARGNVSGTALKTFDLEFPKKQVFSKTDLAKFLNLWRGYPDIVSRGAQKNFAHFADYIGKAWADNADGFNEVYYRHAIAKAIIFRETESLVTRQPWYEGGYRANIVAYAIAKAAHDVANLGGTIPFDAVWKTQSVSAEFREALTVVAERVKDMLVNPPSGFAKNVTEWAKQPQCWVAVKSTRIDWPKPWLKQLLSKEEVRTIEREGIVERKVMNGIEAQTAVVNAGALVWQQVRSWGVERRLLSEKEIEILGVAAGGRVPTDRQSMVIIRTLQRLKTDGCQFGSDIV